MWKTKFEEELEKLLVPRYKDYMEHKDYYIHAKAVEPITKEDILALKELMDKDDWKGFKSE